MVNVVKMPRPVRPPAGFEYDVEIGGVMIGTPCYGGMTHAAYTSAFAHTKLELAKRGIPQGEIFLPNESLIQRARNRIAAEFLAREGFTHLVFIDADLEWKPTDVVRLLSHGVDVVCGVYPKKCDKPVAQYSVAELQMHIDWFEMHKQALLRGQKVPDPALGPSRAAEWPLHPKFDDRGISRYDERTGRIELNSAPTGFLCIRRNVFERMAKAGVVQKIENMQGIGPDLAPHHYDYFWTGIEDGIHWSEDYGFCRKWRQAGGEIWLDPSIKLKHFGMKAYDGDPATIYEEPEQPIVEVA